MAHQHIGQRLATMARSLEELYATAPGWQRSVEAAYAASGDMRPVIEAIFPHETGIHLLQANLPHRQVWMAVLSGLEPADITDKDTLRHNLLLLADDTLLAARFGAEKGKALKPFLHALSPAPLAKGQYDVLAALIDEEAETLSGWIAWDGMLDAYKLREYLFADVATMTTVLAEKVA